MGSHMLGVEACLGSTKCPVRPNWFPAAKTVAAEGVSTPGLESLGEGTFKEAGLKVWETAETKRGATVASTVVSTARNSGPLPYALVQQMY